MNINGCRILLLALALGGCKPSPVHEYAPYQLHEGDDGTMMLVGPKGGRDTAATNVMYEFWTSFEDVYVLWNDDPAKGVILDPLGRTRPYDLSDISGSVTNVSYMGEGYFAADVLFSDWSARILHRNLRADGVFAEGYLFSSTSPVFVDGKITVTRGNTTLTLDKEMMEVENGQEP